jgi:hypothetical protein
MGSLNKQTEAVHHAYGHQSSQSSFQNLISIRSSHAVDHDESILAYMKEIKYYTVAISSIKINGSGIIL